VGHEITLYYSFSPKMVSTRSRVGVNKQVDAGPSGPANITLDMAVILDGQAKMQQELADLKKRSVDEMEALRQENSRLKRKIEADPTQKGKAKKASKAVRSPTFQPTEEESEYNPTPHTFTTTQQTPILSTHPTHLDLLPELREKAQIRNLAAKQRAAMKYNANLCPRSFIKGDLVWRMASSARKKDDKFSANWDDPYRIREDVGEGAYRLEQLSGEEIPNTWNVSHLKFYFS